MAPGAGGGYRGIVESGGGGGGARGRFAAINIPRPVAGFGVAGIAP